MTRQVAPAGAQNLCRVITRMTGLLALLLLAAGCAPDATAPEPAAMAPTFAPEAPDPSTTATTAASAAAPPAPEGEAASGIESGAGSAAMPEPGTSGGPPDPGVLTAAIADPRGDATAAIGDSAPPWADLTAAELRLEGAAFRLRVSLGADAPQRAPDGDRTMNVAAFFDVDGDGTIDYEVWANLAEGGWGGAWYDNRRSTARFADESGVGVEVVDGALLLRFPAAHVGEAGQFRWSLASEWGRYAVIGSMAASRDDAPDDDHAAAFPG